MVEKNKEPNISLALCRSGTPQSNIFTANYGIAVNHVLFPREMTVQNYNNNLNKVENNHILTNIMNYGEANINFNKRK